MDEKKELWETKTDGEVVFHGCLLHVVRDKVTLPNGCPATRELIRHVGAVCVIPVDEKGNVYLERQFRYPIDDVITEIPAGKLNSKEEDRLSAAKRELKEETGLVADRWTDLGVFYPTPAYSDEKITMYLAEDLSLEERSLDEDEFIGVFTRPLADLVRDVMDNKITDVKTQLAVLKAAKILESRKK